MTPVAAATQASLFDLPVSTPLMEMAGTPSYQRDSTSVRARRLVSQLGRESEPVQRVRLALELADLVDLLTTESISDARLCGHTWRQLGIELGVPFQTLFRRFSAATSPREGVTTGG